MAAPILSLASPGSPLATPMAFLAKAKNVASTHTHKHSNKHTNLEKYYIDIKVNNILNCKNRSKTKQICEPFRVTVCKALVKVISNNAKSHTGDMHASFRRNATF